MIINSFPVTVILDNIRSAYNVGSVLRTGACANISGVISCGFTAVANHPRVKKTSLGSEEMLITETFPDFDHYLENFKLWADQPYKIYVFDTKSVLEDQGITNDLPVHSMWDIEFSDDEHNYLVFGHEVDGVRLNKFIEHELEFQLVEIPMPGPKQSINVANSSAIAIYEVIRQLSNA